MAEGENTLRHELEKLDVDHLRRISKLWSIPHAVKDKRTIVKRIIIGMQDDFHIKGVLEKLSSTQVTIYSSLLNSSNNVMTLGEIARKISLPPVNAEVELSVLKRYYLVYQRKNRERLTNNLDRYHYYFESGNSVKTNFNVYHKKPNIRFFDTLLEHPITGPWKKILKKQRTANGRFDAKAIALAAKSENIAKVILSLDKGEMEIVRECFQQGGILEMRQAREIIKTLKKEWEPIVRKLHDWGILIDECYIDDKFVRLIILPQEIFAYLLENPLPSYETKNIRLRSRKQTCNDLDFFLNIKRLISYIKRRGINLAKSGKIKQIDLRETENSLFNTDIALFIEKSQIYQVELLLPVMRLLDIVRVKREDVVLRNEYEKILSMNHFLLLKKTISVVLGERTRRSHYREVFEPLYVQFPSKNLWQECLDYIRKSKRVRHTVVMAAIIREHLLAARIFRIQNFQPQLTELRRELINVLFYLQLFGLIQVEYPERWIELSATGYHYLGKIQPQTTDQVGGIILNPDMSLVAIPEKMSPISLIMLKTFCELKSFDNVYTFQITKQSFQNGILLKGKPKELIEILKRCSRKQLSQNFIFSVNEWSHSFPLVTITDECVVLQTKEAKHMELLLGQISGKHIIQKEISDNTILIHPGKISEVIHYAEKLDLLINLVQ